MTAISPGGYAAVSDHPPAERPVLFPPLEQVTRPGLTTREALCAIPAGLQAAMAGQVGAAAG